MFSRCCFSTCHFNWWRAYSVISNCQNILVASELSMKIFRPTWSVVHGFICCFFSGGVDWSSHYGIFCSAVEKANRGVKYRKRYTINTRLCSKKNWRKPSVVNLWNLGCPAYDLYEKRLIFPGCQRAIVGCQEGPPGAATAQPWNAWFSVCGAYLIFWGKRGLLLVYLKVAPQAAQAYVTRVEYMWVPVHSMTKNSF